MIKKTLFLGLVFCTVGFLDAIVSVGDTPDASTTFQFSVGSAIYDSYNQFLWTLSGQDLSGQTAEIQEYGISYTPFVNIDGSANPSLVSYPYLTSQALITQVDEQGALVVPADAVTNPLLGQSFTSVTFLGSNITVVGSASTHLVYLIQSSLFSDGAFGKISPDGSSIFNVLDFGVGQQIQTIAGSGLGVLFIAHAAGTFGTATSDISFASSTNTNKIINDQYVSCVGMSLQASQSISTTTSQLTAATNTLAALGSSIFMYPSATTALQMYVGLDVTANATAGSCAVGLITALANQESDETAASVTFGSVLPNTVASQGLNTPVSTIANSQITVSNVTTTATSTGLSYILAASYVPGGQQSVYAMPMVTTSSTSTENGMVAAFDSVTQDFQIIGTTYRTQGFSQVIADANEINSAGTTPVVDRLQVGAGPVPLAAGNYITELFALGDAVYIAIQTAFGAGSTPGLFKSQALFDPQGRIMSWSPWQRIAGTDDQILFAIRNRTSNATMYVSGSTSNTVQQTTWNSTNDLATFITTISSALPLSNGGVQGLIPVSNQTTGLQDYTLAIATGNQAVVIAQTGSVDSNGNIVIQSPQNVVTINSALGLDIGSVVTATFAHDSVTGNNWFFMGGDNGLAVLSNDTTGVTFNGQLTSLASITATGMSCKTLGSFKFVKKIAADNNFLYVTTLDGVYQIALVANKFTLANPAVLNAQVVVQSSSLNRYASCIDMLIDTNFMLLGTTNGLYSLDLSGGLPVTPTFIEIPGGVGAVSRLNTISSTGNFDQGFKTSSNLYVLTVNYAYQQAVLNRFSIVDGIVSPIQDQLLEGVNGPLLIFNGMSNNMFIDGSFGFTTSYLIGSTPPALKYLEYNLQAGKSSTQILLKGYTVNLPIASIINSLALAAVTRDYASGCLMLAADFGVLTDS